MVAGFSGISNILPGSVVGILLISPVLTAILLVASAAVSNISSSKFGSEYVAILIITSEH